MGLESSSQLIDAKEIRKSLLTLEFADYLEIQITKLPKIKEKPTITKIVLINSPIC
ncbi:MAG: hypothetical protein ACK4J0_00050 [Candidatus Anstonellaceae archaeon]